MKKHFLAFAAAYAFPLFVFAQTNPAPALEKRPAQVSILPSVGTNGAESYRLYQPFSFNIFGGSNGGVTGFELAGFLNIDRYFVRGLQIAGLVNKVGNNTKSEREVTIPDSTLLSPTVAGLQIAGILNKVHGDMKGLQIGGIHSTGAAVQGGQISGIVNHADKLQGIQIGGILNRATTEMEGAQIGFLNKTSYSRGLQVGFINMADSSSGATLGAINIIKHGGYYRGEFWAGETFYGNAGFKMGTRRLYTILALGYARRQESNFTGYGLGLGFPVGKHMYLEQLVYQVNENRIWTTGSTNLLQQVRLTRESKIGTAALVYGITLNAFTSNKKPKETGQDAGMQLEPYSLYETSSSRSKFAIWPGVNFGIRI